MTPPSKASLGLAEEILDHVNYGLSRADIIREWAEIIDEGNLPLIEAAAELLDSADLNNGVPEPHYISRLRDAMADFQAGSTHPLSRFHAARTEQKGV
ncbi:MAG: hypothetical protein L0Y58_02930 [Verrucomicrobia subdivision 3 bacterium]|nr:hypothetical protein [Limisphaerales bacterium]